MAASASDDASPGFRAATPDLLTDAEQISEEEVDAGRTAATQVLEERGKQ